MGYSSRFSLLPLEGGSAQHRRLASLSLPSANPLPFGHPPSRGRGVDGLLTHSSTLHYPFTENGFQILATFIELKMNLKIGQSHYF